MTIDDVDRASQLEKEAFSTPWTKESFAKIVDSEYAIYVVAIEDEKIVGICGTIVAIGEGEILNVVVDPDYRGRGVATEMLSTLMRRAEEELNVEAFTLEVRVSNKNAIKLYEKMGFVSEGIRPKMYIKPIEDALIMWRR